jgi:putative endonuclease
MTQKGFIYILTNKHTKVLYTGVTSNLQQRMIQHKNGSFVDSFSKRYHLTILVYFEEFNRIEDAIIREKQIKAGSRQKKIDLINKMNPEWKDLFEWCVMNQ